MVTTYDASTALEPFIDARGRFYYEMAKRIWSLDAFGLAPPGAPGPAATGSALATGPVQGSSAGGLHQYRRSAHRLPAQPAALREHPPGRQHRDRLRFHRHRAHQGDENAVGVASNGWAFWQVGSIRFGNATSIISGGRTARLGVCTSVSRGTCLLIGTTAHLSAGTPSCCVVHGRQIAYLPMQRAERSASRWQKDTTVPLMIVNGCGAASSPETVGRSDGQAGSFPRAVTLP